MKKDDNTEQNPRQIRKRAPATNPESRINQLIALAYNLVEQRLLAGTASSQETTTLMKQGTPQAQIEKQILEKQAELITAKTEALQSQKRVEELYSQAMSAFSSYSPSRNDEYEEN